MICGIHETLRDDNMGFVERGNNHLQTYLSFVHQKKNKWTSISLDYINLRSLMLFTV